MPASSITAVTSLGSITGQMDGCTVSFLGIPFAEPSVGEARFKPSVGVACYGNLIADAFGPKCVQRDAMGMLAGEENCLDLNIWTPETGAGSRPVMFFIHGGANIQGSSSELLFNITPTYTGRHLAELGDVVVVTINYRLGPFGFLPLAELVAEGDDGRSGNAAMLDQMEALNWVKAHIANFGGDPDNVTIFGESAGGVNVCGLMASPLASGLFQRAGIQSGACVQPKHDDVVDAFSDWVNEGSCAGTDRLACLRDLNVTTLMEELSGDIGLFEPMFWFDGNMTLLIQPKGERLHRVGA